MRNQTRCTGWMLVAVFAAAGCEMEAAPVGSQQLALTEGQLTALTAVGKSTGISYGLTSTVPETLVVTSAPIEGLARQYAWTGLAGSASLVAINHPPEPGKASSLALQVADAAGNPALQLKPPPDDTTPVASCTVGQGTLSGTSLALRTYPPDPGHPPEPGSWLDVQAYGQSLMRIVANPPPDDNSPPPDDNLPPPDDNSPPPDDQLPPPDDGRVAFTISGGNYTIVGVALPPPDDQRPAQLSFQVRDAAGQVVASFGSQIVGTDTTQITGGQ